MCHIIMGAVHFLMPRFSLWLLAYTMLFTLYQGIYTTWNLFYQHIDVGWWCCAGTRT